jgi:hypothetical protein
MKMSKIEEFDQGLENRGDRAESSSYGTPAEDYGAALSPASDKPLLIIDGADYPATARDLRDSLARSGRIFDRGIPVKVVRSANGGPRAVELTAYQVMIEAHHLRRPVKLANEDELVPVPLPMIVARSTSSMPGTSAPRSRVLRTANSRMAMPPICKS